MSLVDELAKLEELHRSGALSDIEFMQAKTALLNGATARKENGLGGHLANQLAEVHYHNELARIDREWEIERQQYLIRNRYGVAQVPTTGLGVGIAVVGGLFGMFWTIMAVAITSAAPDVGPFSVAKVIFPLVGVLFTAAAIGFGMYAYSCAQKYQQAFAAYKARQAHMKSEPDSTTDQPLD